jgi:hypothetical protein
MFKKVKNFKYLGCEISYKNEKDVQQKVTKVAHILGIINNAFKPTLAHKSSRIKVYNALAVPFILYGREIWTLKKMTENH